MYLQDAAIAVEMPSDTIAGSTVFKTIGQHRRAIAAERSIILPCAHRYAVFAASDPGTLRPAQSTVLAHLLRADLVPEAWAPGEGARELRVALRERMFYVRLRTMTNNPIVTVFDRYPNDGTVEEAR
ncbi:hypothetical protein AJ87_10450 [Rhizobium yanglingense]|nr:hypothetical protein AJ87_10450 [Rhizobium yanglingense]